MRDLEQSARSRQHLRNVQTPGKLVVAARATHHQLGGADLNLDGIALAQQRSEALLKRVDRKAAFLPQALGGLVHVERGQRCRYVHAGYTDACADSAVARAHGVRIETDGPQFRRRQQERAKPPRFAEAALLARARKVPIVVLKTGRSEHGAKVAMSHTSSLAGADALYDALFARYGIARMKSVSAFAVGGPWEAGNSGHFKNNTPPCDAPSDQPHCPGPH